MRPDEILPAVLAADPARPRVTFYDDTPGPTRGERIELSGKVLANWVAKAANLLQDEYDAGPGFRVAIDLPAAHWRAVYWAFAGWAAGATIVSTGHGDADLLVTDDVSPTDPPADVLLVTLPALARQSANPVGAAVDEARVLASYPDRHTPWQRAADSELALDGGTTNWSYADLVGTSSMGGRRLIVGDRTATLRAVAQTFAADGSVLLVRSPDPALMEHRLATEGVTAGL